MSLVRYLSSLGGASIEESASALFHGWCARAQHKDILDEVSFIEQVRAEVSNVHSILSALSCPETHVHACMA
jgi:hypothetical protein